MPKAKTPFAWLDQSHAQALARGLLSEDRSVVNQVQALWLLFDSRADPLLVALASSEDERLRQAAEELKSKVGFPPGTVAARSPFVVEAAPAAPASMTGPTPASPARQVRLSLR